ncbi:hypothetical protein ACCE15_19945 [Pseudomonas parafulva]|uniref:hypothetical protein n=2 Tax=Pseudomonas TaxID=286 RepID=UPI0006D492A7
MQENYDAAPVDCGGSAISAHGCSGVLIRATKPSPKYHTWHHSPNNKEKGGVSFSYLRTDLPITSLAADARSGFTLYPRMQRPAGSISYQVLCAWPTDGDTWTREQQGCGNNSQTTSTERLCHEQGITTAHAWIDEFRRSGDYKRQCAFDVRDTRKSERADAFYQSLTAQRMFASELPFPWNEVIVQAWEEDQSHRLPIQSFFHIEGMWGALEQAQADQKDWYETYGAYIPIIRIRMPQEAHDKATFSYHSNEQAVPTS